MEARSDNSPETSSKGSLPRTGDGIVIDIGTGDGRFVSVSARADPNRFFIGIDPNVGPLKKPSMKATRKPSKGGLPNALFIQAAIQDLPEELNGVADEIHIHFPWGSLFGAVTTGDEEVLRSLYRIAAPGCVLEIVLGLDPERDHSEVERLNIPELTPAYLQAELIPKYGQAGFRLLDSGEVAKEHWRSLESSWARRLGNSNSRRVVFFAFEK